MSQKPLALKNFDLVDYFSFFPNLWKSTTTFFNLRLRFLPLFVVAIIFFLHIFSAIKYFLNKSTRSHVLNLYLCVVSTQSCPKSFFEHFTCDLDFRTNMLTFSLLLCNSCPKLNQKKQEVNEMAEREVKKEVVFRII